MSRPVWTLDSGDAQFDDGGWRARVDLLRPERGLHDVRIAGGSPTDEWRILGVRPITGGELRETERPATGQRGVVDEGPALAAAELSWLETYARVDDLVGTYLQTADRPFRLQAYWRRIEPTAATRGSGGGPGDVRLMELQVSINTSLLDTRPAVLVASRVFGELGERGASAPAEPYVLLRPRGASWSFFQAVHPHDEAPTEIVDGGDGSHAVTHRLFGGFLEKGVIVRARVRAAWLPRTDDAARARAVYEEFAGAALPLTT